MNLKFVLNRVLSVSNEFFIKGINSFDPLF